MEYWEGVLSAGDSEEVTVAESTLTTKLRVTGYRVDFTNDVAAEGAGPALFRLRGEGGDPPIPLASVYLPSEGGHRVGAYSTGWVDLGEGVICTQQDDALLFYSEGLVWNPLVLTAGAVTVVVRGEPVEVGLHLPELVDITPQDLPTTGGATVTVDGYYLHPFVELTVDGTPLAPHIAGGSPTVFFSPVHTASDPENFAAFTLTTSGGTASWPGAFFFYDPDVRPEITSLDVDDLPAGSTDPVTATGVNFDAQGGILGVGFFDSDPGDSIPAHGPSSPGCAGFYNIGFPISDPTEFAFYIGGLPAGSYWLIPALGPDDGSSLRWIGHAYPFTVT